jgi:hypothetical protein
MKTRIHALVGVVGLFGCAGVQIPPERLEKSEGAIRAAEEVGASGVPAAQLHLQLAKDEAAMARTMAKNGNDMAELELARADADAELAVGLAREASMHTAATAAGEDLNAVQARGTP